MKVGILTHFHKSINYGGVLQAYALCKLLNNCGHDTKQILYVPKMTSVSATSLTFKDVYNKGISRLRKRIYRKRNRQIKARMEENFFDFRDAVAHTEREYTRADIVDTNDLFDAFITGSDQVWNPIWHEPAYFLNFVQADTPKISYAASMGVGTLDDAQNEIFKKYLPSLQAISVREKSAAAVLAPLVNRDVNVSVDPTLLLTVEDWDEIAAERKIQERYVFLYALGDDTRIRKMAEKFAKRKGIKLVTIPDLMGTYRRKDRQIKAHMITDATPGDFISLIKHADYVFTDSFHACVFSLLYQREFFAFKRVSSIEMGSRIQNLIEMFECSHRFCTNKKQLNMKHLLSMDTIDYAKTFTSFVREKEKSLDYLEQALGI